MKAEIIKIARGVRWRYVQQFGTPFGGCLDASMALCKQLKKKYTAWVVENYVRIDGGEYHHCWVEIVSGRGRLILDITLDQFDDIGSRLRRYPKVYLAPRSRAWPHVRKPNSGFKLSLEDENQLPTR